MSKRFRIAARALRQLGAELITSDEIALNELIKNAFDAGSNRVSISIHAPLDAGVLEDVAERLEQKRSNVAWAMERLSSKAFPDGIDQDERKRVHRMLKAAETSPSALSECLRKILTEEFWIEVKDSGTGMDSEELQDAFLVIGTPRKWVQKQTQKEFSGRQILGEKGIGRLSMMRLGRYATVTSGRNGDRIWNRIDFDWTDFDDPTKFIEDIPINVEKSNVDKKASESGTVIVVRDLNSNWNKDKIDDFVEAYLQKLHDPFETKQRPFPIDVYFNGQRLPIPPMEQWFQKCAQFRAHYEFDPEVRSGNDIVLTRTLRWRSATSDEMRQWSLDEIIDQTEATQKTLNSLGKFSASCLWFNRSELLVPGIDKSNLEIKAELNKWCGGFAIYRDGFRVGMTGGMEDDWLKMDQKALLAKGFMLNRYQTVGGISITARTNPSLIDAANREGLVAGPEYSAMKNIIGDIVAGDLRMHINTVREVEVKKAISEETTEDALKKSERDLVRATKQVEKIVQIVPENQRGPLGEVREVLHEQVQHVKVLRKSLEMARETRTEILELAGLGLVVEIVVHELVRITERTQDLLGEISESVPSGATDKVIDNLRAQIKATNKRLRGVDALSPSGRHRKEEFDLSAFVGSIIDGYKPRFERHSIQSTLLIDGKERTRPFVVNMVKGLVAQVLENLLTNSVYWVQQATREQISGREITIEVDTKAKALTVTDSGPGIDPKNKEEVFRPYYTTKPKAKGKGLGLFIARELSAYHGAKLYVDDAADKDGRLRTFVLELPKE